MPSLHKWQSSLGDWKRVILSGGLASIVYAGIVFAYSAQSPDIQITESFWSSFGLATLFAFGTIGIPILLWMRYDIRGPSILMALILLLWHVAIHLPIIGSEGGDAPAFALVLFWAPIYLIAYGLLAGGEYWLRGRNIPVLTSSA
ncbi:hypothetical protein ACFFQF_23655 [Haladaptatus pallidirubidus]|uniref:Uncharacterized protein n=1 Tax=Haladaptatus pallidirubidus TaxID=1008152 RepID=A0AAV3UNF5_9EURY|nr:hypothetical protein [Haladaptatus pallidirubidus]